MADAKAPRIARAPADGARAPADKTDKQFWLALSHRQVQELVRQEATNRSGGGRGLLSIVLALNCVGERVRLDELMRDEHYRDRRISQSVIRGLLVLTAFSLGETHGVNSLAAELGISTTTVWRYLKTWVALGVLEERQDRQYQLARPWISELSQPSAAVHRAMRAEPEHRQDLGTSSQSEKHM